MKLKRSIAIYHAIFLITGIATVMLGVLLARASEGDSHSGTLMTIQFGGQVLGSLFVSQRPHRTLMLGLVVSIVAALVLGVLAKPLAPALFLLGIGLGSVMSNVNTSAGLEVEPDKRGSVLELLNVFWPIGAALAPSLARVFQGSFHIYLLLAGLFTPGVLWLAFTKPRQTLLVKSQESVERSIAWPWLANLCLIAFLVIGVETAVANWLPTLAQRNGAGLALAAAIPAGYWCGSLASRFVASLALKRIALHRVNAIAALGTVLMSLLLPVAIRPWMLFGVAIGVACSIAPLYPALLAGCVDLRGKGLIFMSAGLGSSAAPWLVGKVSGLTGSLQRAEGIAAVGAIMMALAMAGAKMFRRRVSLAE